MVGPRLISQYNVGSDVTMHNLDRIWRHDSPCGGIVLPHHEEATNEFITWADRHERPSSSWCACCDGIAGDGDATVTFRLDCLDIGIAPGHGSASPEGGTRKICGGTVTVRSMEILGREPSIEVRWRSIEGALLAAWDAGLLPCEGGLDGPAPTASLFSKTAPPNEEMIMLYKSGHSVGSMTLAAVITELFPSWLDRRLGKPSRLSLRCSA